MKKLFTLGALFFAAQYAVNAQQILSMTVSPASPDDNDTIYVYVDCQFPSMGCAGTAYYSQTGTDVYASALHCVGMLAAICNDVDTIKLNPQPAGTYNVYFTLSSGSGPFPCSPGIVPNDNDMVSFTVTSTSGIEENTSLIKGVFPNPANENCMVEVNPSMVGNSTLILFDETGRELHTQLVNSTHLNLDVSTLSRGIYFIQLANANGSVGSAVKLVKE